MNYFDCTIGLFGIPVTRLGLVGVPELILNKLKEAELVYDDNLSASEFYCPFSRDTYILNQFCELKDAITLEINNYVKTILGHTQQYKITQSWVNKNPPGKGHHRHRHPNSIVSGVFYIDLPENSGELLFYKHTSTDTYEMVPEISAHTKSIYARSHFSMSVSTFDLVLFPSYLEHSVPVNSSFEDRWSLAFNAVPSKSLGSYDHLTHLLL